LKTTVRCPANGFQFVLVSLIIVFQPSISHAQQQVQKAVNPPASANTSTIRSVKIVTEIGPQPAQFGLAARGFLETDFPRCELARTAALNIPYNPNTLPNAETISRLFRSKTVEYFGPKEYAKFSYHFDKNGRKALLTDSDYCLQVPSETLTVINAQIINGCKQTDIEYSTPNRTGVPGRSGRVLVSILAPDECDQRNTENARRAARALVEANANNRDLDRVQTHDCAYDADVVINGVLQIRGFHCKLKAMPIHPHTGKPITLKISSERNITARPFVLGDTTYTEKSIGATIATEVLINAATPIGIFDLPTDAASFPLEILR
jgi:hypothetical protein